MEFFNGWEWLAAVRGHPDKTKLGWTSAHALLPWFKADGSACVSVTTILRDETGFHPDTLRQGFEELERLGLMTRDPQRRKPGTFEYEVRTYRAQMPPG